MLGFITALALFSSLTSALQVTAPTNSSGWQTKGSQLISWNAVSTDPQNFTIQLYTPASPNTPQVIAQVNTSVGSYIWTPSSDLTAGSQYRINLFGSSGSQAGILAQSDYFNVTEGTSTVTPTAMTSTSAAASSTSGGSGSGASSASSAAASASSSRSSADAIIAPGGILLFIAGAVGAFA